MTNEERIQKLTRIAEICNDNEEAMNLLKEIQDDSPVDNGYTDADVMDKDGVRWSDKYAESKRQYRERFFSGSTKDEEPDITDEEEKRRDSESINFDDLFKEGV